jgi:DNA-binding transcriptional ArsR family regulator
MNARRDVFQAIADPTRRAMLLLLAGGMMTPSALAEHFQTSRQAISKHLQVLGACELVQPQQRGREIHYELKPEKMQEIERFLNVFKTRMAQRFSQLDALLENLKNRTS